MAKINQKSMSRLELTNTLARALIARNITRVNIYSPTPGAEDTHIKGVKSLAFNTKTLFIGAGYMEGAEIDLNNIKKVDSMALPDGDVLHLWRRF